MPGIFLHPLCIDAQWTHLDAAVASEGHLHEGCDEAAITDVVPRGNGTLPEQGLRHLKGPAQ